MKWFVRLCILSCLYLPCWSTTPIKINKCCPLDSILYQKTLEDERICIKKKSTNEDLTIWSPIFFDAESVSPLEIVPNYALDEGIPDCSNDSLLVSALHHEHSIDEFKLLSNGSVSHRLSRSGSIIGKERVFHLGDYCLDEILRNDSEKMEFAFFCVKLSDHHSNSFQRIVEDVFYPIGLAISILCLILTFLLYSFLPQLRDLTGKFILGICLGLVMTFSLIFVDIFGWKDPNVEKLTVELLLHTSILSIWLCLLSMGHHVWFCIRSKTVFTRVTDGQKLLYYSIFIFAGVGVIAGIALGVHLVLEKGESSRENFRLGWGTIGTFYVLIGIIFCTNLYFYWTSQRRMRRQLVYNKSMQHFQVNFDLFVKFLIVIGVWWFFEMLSFFRVDALKYISMIFNIIQGPLVFCVAMCRTRVAYLFKKYFCYDACCFGCCKQEEFINENCQELATIDSLKLREEKESNDFPNTSTFLLPDTNRQISRSLFNIRNGNGNNSTLDRSELDPLNPDADESIGKISRLLKSNSMNAIVNTNFGWRKETSV
ncbi:probable G-protein coupled receptor Mth-like 5 isoform X1 [Lepeophtheirus salmonis]|uniref:probable G-protein coupled receptor Mth-like 5 isoform X1 n=1 Tax=Lepeophtheirus salmonis TaxID=72036 RepID=UPI001AE69201|nr:probable G-protein coupled receptor Mth-like 5 [Lepeophtheirus salmonis]